MSRKPCNLENGLLKQILRTEQIQRSFLQNYYLFDFPWARQCFCKIQRVLHSANLISTAFLTNKFISNSMLPQKLKTPINEIPAILPIMLPKPSSKKKKKKLQKPCQRMDDVIKLDLLCAMICHNKVMRLDTMFMI